MLVLLVLTGRVRDILVGFQAGDLGGRHPGRVIFIGAVPIIFCCCIYVASDEAGYVVYGRFGVNYVRNFDGGEGGEGGRHFSIVDQIPLYYAVCCF